MNEQALTGFFDELEKQARMMVAPVMRQGLHNELLGAGIRSAQMGNPELSWFGKMLAPKAFQTGRTMGKTLTPAELQMLSGVPMESTGARAVLDRLTGPVIKPTTVIPRQVPQLGQGGAEILRRLQSPEGQRAAAVFHMLPA